MAFICIQLINHAITSFFYRYESYYVKKGTNSCFIELNNGYEFLKCIIFVLGKREYLLVGKMEGLVGILEHLVGKKVSLVGKNI